MPPPVTWIGDVRRRLDANPRLARVLHGGLSGLAGRATAMAVSAITLPVTVRYLGPLEYGIWVTISTTVVMLAVLDIGIASTLTNFISKAYAVEDEAMAKRYFATAFWLTVGISAVLATVAWPIWRLVNWGALFGVEGGSIAGQARLCVGISLGFFILSLPLNLANRVLGGYQKVHLSNYFSIANSILGLVAILVSVWLRLSIVGMMLAYCIAMLTGTLLLNIWIAVWYRPGLRPGLRAVRRSAMRDLFGQGALFFVLQLSGLIVFNSDNLVISHYLGAREVTPYSVAWRLVGYASMMQSLLVPALWPAFSEAYHRGDMGWIRTTYRRTMNGSIAAVGIVALLIGLLGRQLIHVWAGSAAVPSAPLLWTMSFWAVLLSITVNQAMLMAATQRIGLQTVTAVLAAVANLALSIVLVQRIGAMGVLFATIGSYLVFIVVPQTWEVRRILRGTYLERLVAEEI